MLHSSASRPRTADVAAGSASLRSRRRETVCAVYLVTAAVALSVALLTGTVMVLLFADAAVVGLWLAGAVVAFPVVSLLMRSASERLAAAITAAGR